MGRKDKILIFGAGGHGKVVLDILLELGKDVLGFLDDDRSAMSRSIRGYKVLGDWSFVKEKSDSFKIVLGIGNNKIREKMFFKAKSLGLELISAIHPRAIVSKDVKIGVGAIIMPGAVVNSGTVIEDGAVVNTGATVDHDCYLARFSQLWPGSHLAGTVRIGEFSYIGTGANVIQNIDIGKDAIIGAGAVIISNIPDNSTVVGNPGKVVKKNE